MISILFSAFVGFIIGCTSSMFSRNKQVYARLSNVLISTFGSLVLTSIFLIFGFVAPVLPVAVIGALVSLMLLVHYRRVTFNNMVQ